jgi:hypothetical protein
MRLKNKPRTFIRIERKMTKLRLKGRYNRKTNTFQVQVWNYNPVARRWNTLGKRTKLARASKRRQAMFGTLKSGGGTTTYSK